MNETLDAKRAAAANVNRALAVTLRSPAAAAKVRRASVALAPTRRGQRANRVPLNRQGQPHA